MAEHQLLNLYKAGRSKVEDKLENPFAGAESKEKLLLNFFGVEKDTLSPEEEESFELYARYAQKRIFNASLHKNKVTPGEVEGYVDKHFDPANNFAFHDLSHTIASYKNTSKMNANSIVPEFFKTEDHNEVNNVKLIEEEAFALIFMNPFQNDKPLSLAILNEESRRMFLDLIQGYRQQGLSTMVDSIDAAFSSINSSSLESYIHTYLVVVYGLVEITNTRAIFNQNEGRPDEIQKLKTEYYVITEKLTSSPDPQLVEILTRIFNNRENPKVLYNEFYKICEPLINNLKKRK